MAIESSNRRIHTPEEHWRPEQPETIETIQKLRIAQKACEDVHANRPFPAEAVNGASSLETTIARTCRVMENIGFGNDIQRIDGRLEGQGMSVPHSWLEFDGYIIDTYYPLRHADTYNVLRDYIHMSEYTDQATMLRIFRGLPCQYRVFGSPPEGFWYTPDTRKYDHQIIKKSGYLG